MKRSWRKFDESLSAQSRGKDRELPVEHRPDLPVVIGHTRGARGDRRLGQRPGVDPVEPCLEVREVAVARRRSERRALDVLEDRLAQKQEIVGACEGEACRRPGLRLAGNEERGRGEEGEEGRRFMVSLCSRAAARRGRRAFGPRRTSRVAGSWSFRRP
jgi:hypothetical protein